MQGWTLVSFAGLSVSRNFQVLDPQRKAISNLYAIGEVIGAGATSGAAYTNGMLVTPAITFGRLLGSALQGEAKHGSFNKSFCRLKRRQYGDFRY